MALKILNSMDWSVLYYELANKFRTKATLNNCLTTIVAKHF